MARLILHSRYFKSGAPGRTNQIEYLINYIGTREGVELMGEKWKKDPETKSQKEMIEKLLKDVPELKDTHEWEDYAANPTKGNASEVITMGTEMVMSETGKVQNYVDYIANRPRVDKEDKQHGLFTQTDGNIDLAATAKMVSEHPGNVWTNVISLRREDAERLCYANADAWRTLVRAHMADLAAAWKIPPQDFQWYAAFHNESHHPHIHMVCYSTGREGYLTKTGIEEAKSSLAKEIFAQDLQHTYVRQTELRQEIKAVADRYLQLAKELPGEAERLSGRLEPLIAEIHRRLPDHGRLQYAYMPAEVKNLIDAAVDVLEKNEKISELYQLWYEQKCAVLATYRSTFPDKEPLKDNETFRSIKNAVLHMAQEYDPTQVKMEDLVKPGKESAYVRQEKKARAALEEKIARILREMQERNTVKGELSDAETSEEADETPETFAPSETGSEEADPAGDRTLEAPVRDRKAESRSRENLENMLERLRQEHEIPEEMSPSEAVQDDPEPERPIRWETAGEAWEREEKEQEEKTKRAAAAKTPVPEAAPADADQQLAKVDKAAQNYLLNQVAEWLGEPKLWGDYPEPEAGTLVNVGNRKVPELHSMGEVMDALEGISDARFERYLGKMADLGESKPLQYHLKALWKISQKQETMEDKIHDFDESEYTPEQMEAIERAMLGMARPEDRELLAKRHEGAGRRRKPGGGVQRQQTQNTFNDFKHRKQSKEYWEAVERIMAGRSRPGDEEILEGKGHALEEGPSDAEAAVEALAERDPAARAAGRGGSLPNLWSQEFKAARSAYRKLDFPAAYQGFLAEHRSGNPLATMWLAQLTERGLGTERNEPEAETLYDKAVEGFLEVYKKCGTSYIPEKEQDYAKYLQSYLPYRIGKLHARKEGYAEAAEWYQKSDTPYAKFGLGGLYERGQGVEKNRETAFALYKAAADMSAKKNAEKKAQKEYLKAIERRMEGRSRPGDAKILESEGHALEDKQQNGFPFAEYKVAVMSEDPAEKEEYYQRAFVGFTELSEQEDADDLIFYRLGEMLRRGNGCEADLSAAVAMYEKAVEMHNKHAAYRLGMICLEKDGEFYDPDRGLELLRIAAEDSEWGKPNPDAQYQLAKVYLAGELVMEDRVAGMDYLRAAADQNHAMAQYRLGRELLEAEEATVDQIAEGLEWLQKAVEQENPYAQYYLAKLYLEGEIVPEDRVAGMGYLRAAADQGYDMAQYWLGKELAYADDAGEEQISEGLLWLQKSADQENCYALYLLAKTYIQGKLVPRDIELGMQYLQAAADQGMELAQERLRRGVEGWMHEYQPPILPGCVRMLGQIGRIFETQRPGRGLTPGIDRKLLRELQEKKEAMGLRM